MGIVDHYTLRGRLLPVLIVVLPIGLLIITFQPSQSEGINFLASVLVSFGLTALLAQLGRDRGKQKEAELFEKIGGKPSTLMLSFEYSELDHETLVRCHNKLQTIVPGVTMPTQEEEAKDRSAAFIKYDSCVNFLREHTRDKKGFPLVYAELLNYGFRRNLWGMKPAGIMIAVLCSIGCMAAVLYQFASGAQNIVVSISALIIVVALLVWWLLRINAKWVKLTAFAYARQLILSCELL